MPSRDVLDHEVAQVSPPVVRVWMVAHAFYELSRMFEAESHPLMPWAEGVNPESALPKAGKRARRAEPSGVTSKSPFPTGKVAVGPCRGSGTQRFRAPEGDRVDQGSALHDRPHDEAPDELPCMRPFQEPGKCVVCEREITEGYLTQSGRPACGVCAAMRPWLLSALQEE